MLHLRGARCGRSLTASAAPSATTFYAASVQDAPSTPNRTPPLAIYLRLVALFLFWR